MGYLRVRIGGRIEKESRFIAIIVVGRLKSILPPDKQSSSRQAINSSLHGPVPWTNLLRWQLYVSRHAVLAKKNSRWHRRCHWWWRRPSPSYHNQRLFCRPSYPTARHRDHTNKGRDSMDKSLLSHPVSDLLPLLHRKSLNKNKNEDATVILKIDVPRYANEEPPLLPQMDNWLHSK